MIKKLLLVILASIYAGAYFVVSCSVPGQNFEYAIIFLPVLFVVSVLVNDNPFRG